jgi:DNA-binding GntR family transcriptional regulator
VTAERKTATRIPRATFASMVGERIRSDITDGTLKPGSQLNEVELAASFGVSRGPVREALQRLIQEGLLRSEPHRGVFVPVMSPEDVDDIYLAREALETAAVRQITASAQAPQIYQELDRVVRAMEDAEKGGEWEVVASRDLDFHLALVGASGSPRLERMFTTVIFETRLCLSVLTGAYDRRDDLVDEHRQIIEMIKEGDTEGAVAVLQKHFSDAVVTLRSRHEDPNHSGAEVG